MNELCKCSMRIRVVGDGCRYCNPQHYIDKLEEQIDDNAHAVDCHDELVEALEEGVEALRFIQDHAHMKVNPPTLERMEAILAKVRR